MNADLKSRPVLSTACSAGFVLALILSLAPWANAAKPAKPSDPPPPAAEAGTIFFKLGDGSVYEMQADGSGFAKVIDIEDIRADVYGWTYSGRDLQPSNQTYDGQHWWIWMGELGETYPSNDATIKEVFVGIPGKWKVQLTHLWKDYGIVLDASARTLAWSNGNSDTFISVRGFQYALEYVQDQSGELAEKWVFKSRNYYKIPFHVVQGEDGLEPVPPVELALNADGELLLDDGGDPILVTAFDAVLPSALLDPYSTIHNWSPDGSTLLWNDSVETSVGSRQFRAQLWMQDTAIGESEVLYGFPNGISVEVAQADPLPALIWEDDRVSGSFTSVQQLAPQWSPEGTRIAFARFNGSTAYAKDVVTIPSDAPDTLVGLNGATVVLTNATNGYWGYSTPFWSPLNGSQIVARELDCRKGIDTSRFPRNVVRVQSAGGSPVRLTGSLDQRTEKILLGWRLGLPWAP